MQVTSRLWIHPFGVCVPPPPFGLFASTPNPFPGECPAIPPSGRVPVREKDNPGFRSEDSLLVCPGLAQNRPTHKLVMIVCHVSRVMATHPTHNLLLSLCVCLLLSFCPLRGVRTQNPHTQNFDCVFVFAPTGCLDAFPTHNLLRSLYLYVIVLSFFCFLYRTITWGYKSLIKRGHRAPEKECVILCVVFFKTE